MNKVEILKQVNYGDIDGLYDPNLLEYFIDFDYWSNIIEKDIFYVIGRKGTGKSAIYSWIEKKAHGTNYLISNMSFRDFPFEKLLSLSDDDFTAPNQYQSIWRNIILSEIAYLIIKDQTNNVNDEWLMLKDYIDFFIDDSPLDLHKATLKNTRKTSNGLERIIKVGCENELSVDIKNDFCNVTAANRKLEQIIICYLKTNETNKYIIQFDQLDDIYNAYTEKEKYFQSIISLFKTIYTINQILRSNKINTKIIAYLRSDIYNAIHQKDPESARWEDFVYRLSWTIISKNDWRNPKLLQILNKRIKASNIQELNHIESPFNFIFDDSEIKLKDLNGKYKTVLRYMVDRSFHRPRDIIQFAKKIQNKVIERNIINHFSIKDAEKDYSLWFLSELENEISAIIKDMDSLYSFLRAFGKSNFTLSMFNAEYEKYKSKIQIDNIKLIEMLYDLGIIMNIDVRTMPISHYSIIRNERSRFNKDLQIVIHRGYWSSLSTSHFLKHY